jgi:endonuclease/exonuclease/phosphatase (EEP) superfamily protein YafD
VSSNIASFNETKDELIKFIAPENPDVILLFEVSPDWLETLKPLEDVYPYHVVAPHAVHAGTAIYSRSPFEESDLKFVGDPNSPMLVRTLLINGGKLTVVGAHPKSPVSWANTLDRNEELIELAELVVTLPQPLIVAGDLNTSSWNPAFKRLVHDTGLRDSRQGFGVQLSWPSFVPLLRTTIDHCLVSPRVHVLERRVGPNIGSDHFPIIVDLHVDLKD